MPSTAWQSSVLKPPPMMGTQGHTFPPSENVAKATWGMWFKCRGLGQGLGVCISNKFWGDGDAPVQGPHFESSRHLISPTAQVGNGLRGTKGLPRHHAGRSTRPDLLPQLFSLRARRGGQQGLGPCPWGAHSLEGPEQLRLTGDPPAGLGAQVQSFLRGWLCRRKWKTIIQDYIRSPHADSMRKRNQVVFSMLEAEAEYVQQLHILVNNFLRPLRMAASSKKPPITHDDVSSIFLNR